MATRQLYRATEPLYIALRQPLRSGRTLRQPRAFSSKASRLTSSAATSNTNTGSNAPLSFPCVDQNETRHAKLLQKQQEQKQAHKGKGKASDVDDGVDESGPEPAYSNIVSGYKIFHYSQPFALDYGGSLPEFDIAYETWGTLNADRTNAILVHTGLSASSHAHSTPENPAEGWWERFIGPGKALDTNEFFVICTNVIGGCYGSTGPSSIDPSDGKPYATRFPILSIFDMVRAQFRLLDALGVEKLYASVGSSMGGMQSIAAAHLEPDRIEKVVSISGSARSSPSSIALRYAQRSVLMADPNWNRGFYYGQTPPHTGMKLARQIATITYRSGPEWEQRFSRARRPALPTSSFANPSSAQEAGLPNTPPVLCPDFLIETYLDHQGEQFCFKFDPNSLLYISKAMDLFSMEIESLQELSQARQAAARADALCPPDVKLPRAHNKGPQHISSLPSSHAYLPSLTAGLANLKNHPVMVLGVQSDILFPFEQQKEMAEAIRRNGNKRVVYYELDSPYGHDTFLIDLQGVYGALKGFLARA